MSPESTWGDEPEQGPAAWLLPSGQNAAPDNGPSATPRGKARSHERATPPEQPNSKKTDGAGTNGDGDERDHRPAMARRTGPRLSI